MYLKIDHKGFLSIRIKVVIAKQVVQSNEHMVGTLFGFLIDWNSGFEFNKIGWFWTMEKSQIV